MTINDAVLQDYAELLARNGFTIYEPGAHWKRFHFSQVVDGQVCYGVVQKEYVGSGYWFAMPIKPSKRNGSVMFLNSLRRELTSSMLTVEAARLVAQPTNSNSLVGLQENHGDTRSLDRCTVWGPTDEAG